LVARWTEAGLPPGESNPDSAGAPVKLFTFQARAGISSTDLFTYDATKDGQRFIVNRYVKPEAIALLMVVLNAGAE
jgi:hypothetical protein